MVVVVEVGVVEVEVLVEVAEVVEDVEDVEVVEVVVVVYDLVVDVVVVVEQNDGAATFPGLTPHPLVTRARPAESTQSY